MTVDTLNLHTALTKVDFYHECPVRKVLKDLIQIFLCTKTPNLSINIYMCCGQLCSGSCLLWHLQKKKKLLLYKILKNVHIALKIFSTYKVYAHSSIYNA